MSAGEFSVFLRNDRDGGAARAFSEPAGYVTCHDAAGIEDAFAAIEAALERGLNVAGCFAYELGYALEPRLAPLMRGNAPLIHVGLFRRAERLSPGEAQAVLDAHGTARRGSTVDFVHQPRPDYERRIELILDYIAAGDVYQVNYTFPLRFAWDDGPWPLYARLAQHQSVAYGAVIDLPEAKAVSLSPELFFRKTGSRIVARPMKGTARRGADAVADAEIAATLARDAKNRAENLMIVDLIRNDLARIARVGSVKVEALYAIETYETLHQMTSTVAASVAPDAPLSALFQALFPCGSVTGAPKIRAIEIIAELEGEPRGVYTGAIGWMAPDRSMAFSVPIRTVELRDGTAAMGIGSGIVADSEPSAEYDECLLKADFLRRALA